MPSFPLPAGQGDSKSYKITTEPNGQPLQKGQHYLRINVHSWYINNQSNFLKKKTATGTISIAVGQKSPINLALGTYELIGGSKTAPIFDREVFSATAYMGGAIKIDLFLHGVRQDTQVSNLLKGAAAASLNIATGMTVSATGLAAKAFTEAGKHLINGVQNIIKENNNPSFRIFDTLNGISKTIYPEEVTGKACYWLFHRGSTLDESKLSIEKDNSNIVPKYKGKQLTDGAWVLLSFTKEDEFPEIRPWKQAIDKFIDELDQLVDEVLLIEITSKEEALKKLLPSDSGASLYDQYIAIRTTIFEDKALIRSEKVIWITTLRERFVNAKTAIQKSDVKHYKMENYKAKQAITAGEIGKERKQQMLTTLEDLNRYDEAAHEHDTKSLVDDAITLDEIFSNLKFKTKAISVLE